MKYFRLIEKIHEETPLGYGKSGGRWNTNGTSIIYASNVSAINFLEMLSIKGAIVATTKWLLITLDVKNEIPYLESKDLPRNWNVRPYPLSTQRFGTNWSQNQVSLCLKVPSCRLPLSRYPGEHNLLINPSHHEFGNSITAESIEIVDFEINKWV